MNNRTTAAAVVILVFVLSGAYLFWEWGFCRFYVGPNEMAVVTAKTGDPLPAGQILATRAQKGVWEEVLGEGRHFLNPIIYEWQILPVTLIPPGKVGIVTSKVGADLPTGEFLADPAKKQKGIWRPVLGPGKYRLNPIGYKIDVVDAISVPVGYAGVLTSLSGAQAPEGKFAEAGQKGVREDILQPGLYYINPREYAVDILEIGVNQISFLGTKGGQVIAKGQILSQNKAMDELQTNLLRANAERRNDYLQKQQALQPQVQADFEQAEPPGRMPPGVPAPAKPAAKQKRVVPMQQQMDMTGGTFVLDQFVGFPSRDGFDISLDMTVEFELLPKNLAWIYRSYGDLPAVVDKVINPQIQSASRMKGSAYGARDFIVGEGREKFQSELTEALGKTLVERKILVHSTLIRHVNVPNQILEPIQEASVAVEQDLTNKEKQNTAKKQAELNTEVSLIDQRREQVVQETEKLKAEIQADQDKQVAEIKGGTTKLVAEVQKQTASIFAERVTRLGKADAEKIRMVEGEKAKGFQLKTQAFEDPVAFSLWNFSQNLNPELKVNFLHAGNGTLWTDLENARLGDLGGAQAIQKNAAAPAGTKAGK